MTGPVSLPGNNDSRVYQGYIIAGLAFLVITVAQGIFNAFGVLFNPLMTEFSWTSAMTSGAFSLSMVLRGLFGIIVGGVTDRFGPRIVLVTCGTLIALGYFFMSRIGSVWQFYIVYGMFIGIGMSGIWVPLLSSVARWFERRRALVTGFVVAGVGIGGFIAPPLLNRLIEATDWRITYTAQAGLVFLVVVGAGLFFRRPPEPGQNTSPGMTPGTANQPAPSLTIRDALRTRQLWLALGAFFFSGFCGFSYMVHLVPHAEGLGISSLDASTLLGVMNGVSLVGILGLGSALGDRLGSQRVFQISFVMMLAAAVIMVFAGDLPALYVFAVLFGISIGGMSASESPLVAHLFGMESHGLLFGISGLGFTAGTALGPLVTGFLYDITGDYRAAFIVCVAVAALGLLAISLVKPVKTTTA